MKYTYTEFCANQTINALKNIQGIYTGHDLGLKVSEYLSENLVVENWIDKAESWKKEIQSYYEFAEEEIGIGIDPADDMKGFIVESIAFSAKILFGLSDTARATWMQPVNTKEIQADLIFDFKTVKKIIFHEI